MFISIVKEWVE